MLVEAATDRTKTQLLDKTDPLSGINGKILEILQIQLNSGHGPGQVWPKVVSPNVFGIFGPSV